MVTATEEFGIAAVEAQAAGRPVIAPRAGGVLETVIDGETGCFYDARSLDALAAAVRAFDALARRPGGLRGERARASTPTSSTPGCSRRSTRAGRRDRRASGPSRAARARAAGARRSPGPREGRRGRPGARQPGLAAGAAWPR